MKTQLQILWSVAALSALALPACGGGGAGAAAASPGTSGTQTGQSCVDSDLIAQCPPGSQPDLSAAATSECEGQTDFLLSGDGGSVHGACRGTGECLVVCNFDSPCTCGVDRITTEGIFCTDCATASACGNAICEGGEDAVTCPLDCAAACTNGSRRCNGRDVEACDVQGQWEKVVCRADQACEIYGGVAACQADVSPGGGTYDGTGWQTVHLPFDPADIYFPQAEIVCLQNTPACVPLAWADDTHVIGTAMGALALLSTTGTPPEPLPVDVSHGLPAVAPPWALVAGRQPEIYNVTTRQDRVGEAIVDDVTPLTWGAGAIDPASHRGAVAFEAAGQPFVVLYDLETGQIEAMLRFARTGYATAASGLAFSPDGGLLAETRPEGLVIVWNVEERKYTHLIEAEPSGPENRPSAQMAVFTPGEGPFLVVATGAGLEVWNLDTAARLRRGDPRTGPGGPFTLSPDGRVLAGSAFNGGGLGLYFIQTLAPIRDLGGVGQLAPLGGNATYGGVFSTDGRRIVVGNLVYTADAL